MIKLIARAFLTATFAAAVFAGIYVLTVPETWDFMSRWASAPSTLKGARDFLAQAGLDRSGDPGNVLAVETIEETTQDGTTSQWGGGNGAPNYQVPSYVTRKYLKITSKVDEIAINSIEINRGNCEHLTAAKGWGPVPLKFGGSKSVWITCDPIEAKIGTDRGTFSFNW